jgi:hypothetical protein
MDQGIHHKGLKNTFFLCVMGGAGMGLIGTRIGSLLFDLEIEDGIGLFASSIMRCNQGFQEDGAAVETAGVP